MRALALILVAGCTTSSTDGTGEAKITGDSCELYTEAGGCTADAACTWLGTGCACPANDPACTCPAGACVSKTGDTGGGTGGGGTACACPADGVCYEQIGGPATSEPPAVGCATPAAGSGDPCARIQNEGHCTASTSVTGLCLCDNGER